MEHATPLTCISGKLIGFALDVTLPDEGVPPPFLEDSYGTWEGNLGGEMVGKEGLEPPTSCL